jgi:fructose-bisphosphate aldolase/2-amino-3,7-dideoxy-D-threo-hept-6-ulosonate synthase
MSTGKSIRLGRIFNRKSGTALIVPIDHGVEEYVPELENPRDLIASLADVGPDAFLLRRGLARKALESFAGKSSLILRITCATGLRGQLAEQAYTSSVEEAIRMGADAVVPNIFVGSERELQDLHNLGALADACDEWGMPLMVEVFPARGKDAKPFDGPYAVDDLRAAVRVVGEEGCDFVKTYYTGDSESFRKVTSYSLAPVVIAGGPRAKTTEDTLRMVDGALRGGAQGICLGRKVWGSPSPSATLEALKRIVRERMPVEKALAELKTV